MAAVVTAMMPAVPRGGVAALVLVRDLSRLQAVVEVGMSLLTPLLVVRVSGGRELGLGNGVADRRWRLDVEDGLFLHHCRRWCPLPLHLLGVRVAGRTLPA